ncbi:hypothetical protein [Phaeodactylibacter sp.]|uniref:hypothetical protein n=1 Tax=Phaeodactylibacter sp. TaxID=1940289 RepID=UPI0025E91DF6|nr:hypothetical protein [Phaeodactylibacter sp.]MCI5093489.1 hypothetical protein [Phaeodactylibacter sp.]
MKTIITSFAVLLSCIHFLSSQNTWIIGYDTTAINSGGGTSISFMGASTPPNISYLQKQMDILNCPAVLDDDMGNLQFYSNGCYVSDANHNKMPGSDSLTTGQFIDVYCDQGLGGLGLQTTIALPAVSNERYKYLFKYNYKFIAQNGGDIRGVELVYCKIDMDGNDGLGEMIERNVSIVTDTFPTGYLSAVKHADGMSWWLLAPKSSSNTYHKILLDSTGIHYMGAQSIGRVWDHRDWTGQSTFTPIGAHYLRHSNFNKLNIFDFDRCTGNLSDPIIIDVENTDYAAAGVSVSSNSRFAYVSTFSNLYQFDLEAGDIEQSKTLIDTYDEAPFPYYSGFSLSALAPDQKIYIAGTSSHKHLHVVNSPNEPGLECSFSQHGLDIPSFNFAGIPNVPHFNTEELDCLPSSNSNIEATNIECILFPNPVEQGQDFQLNIKGIPIREEHEVRFYSSSGNLLESHSLSQGQITISTTSWPIGNYYYTIYPVKDLAGKFIVF